MNFNKIDQGITEEQVKLAEDKLFELLARLVGRAESFSNFFLNQRNKAIILFGVHHNLTLNNKTVYDEKSNSINWSIIELVNLSNSIDDLILVIDSVNPDVKNVSEIISNYIYKEIDFDFSTIEMTGLHREFLIHAKCLFDIKLNLSSKENKFYLNLLFSEVKNNKCLEIVLLFALGTERIVSNNCPVLGNLFDSNIVVDLVHANDDIKISKLNEQQLVVLIYDPKNANLCTKFAASKTLSLSTIKSFDDYFMTEKAYSSFREGLLNNPNIDESILHKLITYGNSDIQTKAMKKLADLKGLSSFL